MKTKEYIQYGCGWSAPYGFVNFDSSPTLRFERFPLIGKLYTKNATRFPDNVDYGDILKGLPIDKCSLKGVYCSHVLEHLTLEGFRIALQNTFILLQPQGVFRFVLPDLEYYITRYLNNRSSDAAISFLVESGLGETHRINNLFGYIKTLFGNSRHLWMWDYKAVEQELRATGFVGIRRAYFGDSLDQKFKEVEDKERWDNCLGLECHKP